MVSERRRDPEGRLERIPPGGILLALGGAVGQALGLVLAKYGMGSYNAFASTQIRVLAGIVGFAVVFTATGRWPRVRAALSDRRAMTGTAVGAFFGPFIGVSLSLLAVQYTEAGVAATLMALTPVLIIPVSVVIYREHIAWQAAVGAAVAVCGSALLCLGSLRSGAPISSSIYGVPSEVQIGVEHGLKHESAVNLDHVQTVDHARPSGIIGHLNDDTMNEVCRALTVAAGCPISC